MDFKEQKEYYISQIEGYLQGAILSKEGPINQVIEGMKYSLQGGGKRVRGMLVLAFCEDVGTPCDIALPIAAAVEMIHAYSLIHDDLPCMDDDDMRRGKPSCHKVYGENVALLAGSALLTLAFQVVAETPLSLEVKVKIIQILSECSGYLGMIGGQVIDIDSEGKTISLDLLKEMHARKTGALISASCQIGELCGGRQEPSARSIAYGKKVGQAFQVIDDILDVVGDETLLGKPIGSDIQQEKSTYVTLLGLEEAKKIGENLSKESQESLKECDSHNQEFLLKFTDYLLKRNV